MKTSIADGQVQDPGYPNARRAQDGLGSGQGPTSCEVGEGGRLGCWESRDEVKGGGRIDGPSRLRGVWGMRAHIPVYAFDRHSPTETRCLGSADVLSSYGLDCIPKQTSAEPSAGRSERPGLPIHILVDRAEAVPAL